MSIGRLLGCCVVSGGKSPSGYGCERVKVLGLGFKVEGAAQQPGSVHEGGTGPCPEIRAAGLYVYNSSFGSCFGGNKQQHSAVYEPFIPDAKPCQSLKPYTSSRSATWRVRDVQLWRRHSWSCWVWCATNTLTKPFHLLNHKPGMAAGARPGEGWRVHCGGGAAGGAPGRGAQGQEGQGASARLPGSCLPWIMAANFFILHMLVLDFLPR